MPRKTYPDHLKRNRANDVNMTLNEEVNDFLKDYKGFIDDYHRRAQNNLATIATLFERAYMIIERLRNTRDLPKE